MIGATPTTFPETARSERRRRLFRLCLGVWTVFVLLALYWLLRTDGGGDSGPAWVVHGGDPSRLTFAERARDWFRLAHLNFQRIYPWVLFGPYVILLATRFHLERNRLPINLAVHLTGCAFFAAASYAINSRVSIGMARVVVVTTRHETAPLDGQPQETKMLKMQVVAPGPAALLKSEEIFTAHQTHGALTAAVSVSRREFADSLPTNLLPELQEAFKPSVARAGPFALRPLATLLDLLAYASLAGMAQAVHFYRRFRERERRALFLESNLTRARLNALQAQLQPHFLFNTLNAIATLLRRDPRAAEATLTSLSELLRLALSQSDKQQIPLREELRFLQRYMEIQQTRFGDRLSFQQDVEPRALDCLVPTLMLQPLVENAIRHGIEPSPNPGTVRVTARQLDQRLTLSVEDDGVGLGSAPPATDQKGIGLANLQARLQALYGDDQSMEMIARPEGGVAVRIEIPWQPASTVEAAAVGSES